jgi:integrase
MLAKASVKMKAVTLLALNAALYPSEVAAVQKGDLDLDKGTLVMTRRKTGIPRIAVLWSRTVAAIRAYEASKRANISPYLFLNAAGKPHNAQQIGAIWLRLRARAGVPFHVEFASIRDGAFTVGSQNGATNDQAKMLAGHKLPGVSDHYLKRNPQMVATACAAIESHYFSAAR